MRMRMTMLTLGLLFIPGADAGELYRWVDSEGRVHYTDQPPPGDALEQERKRFGDKPPDIPLPYSLQQAVKNFPVTLYSADSCGDSCDKASAHLGRRGIPHTVKDARTPTYGEEVKSLTGRVQVPVLVVGRNVLTGYEETQWDRTLDAAGYPAKAVVSRPPVTIAPKEPEQPPPAVPEPAAPAPN